jgi:Undecaprenyl-phosphate galactose phosphotransferase WbaP
MDNTMNKIGQVAERMGYAHADTDVAKRESSHANSIEDQASLRRRPFVVPILLLSDALLALVVWGAALLVQDVWGYGAPTQLAYISVAANILVWIILRALLGLYPGYGIDEAQELRCQTYAVVTTLAITTVFAFAFKVSGSLSRLLLLVGFLGLLLLAPLVRYLVKAAMKKAGLWGKPVVIIGEGEAGRHLIGTLKREWKLGFRPAAVFDQRTIHTGGSVEHVPFGGNLEDAVRLAEKHKIDTAIFAMPHTPRERLAPLVSQASVTFRHVMVILDTSGITNAAAVARDLGDTFGLEMAFNLLNPWARRSKRIFDLSSAVVGLLLISPLLVMICILIKLESPGPAIFVQERPGRDGKMFRVFKFRTMCIDAEQIFQQLVHDNPLLAKEFEEHGKLKDDPRVTRIGAWLRKTSLDELPQVWNVIKGDMSLVGPRPYLVEQEPQMNGAGAVISRVAPGISGLWQVSGRSGITFEERLALDLYYVRNWSVWLDVVILARTARCVLLRRGAY